MENGAIFSSCDLYRYALWRIWNTQLSKVHFIGLNPSTANAKWDDPTIKRCTQFVRDWGYGGFYITNLFAFRSPDPKLLYASNDPIGQENDQYIRFCNELSSKTILIWGNHGKLNGRNLEVQKLITKPWCLKRNKTGEPAHLLYLKGNLLPKPY